MTTAATLTLATAAWKGRANPNHDSNCDVCGRSMSYHSGVYVRIVEQTETTTTFGAIASDEGYTEATAHALGAAGSACARLLPRGFKMTRAQAIKHGDNI